MENRISWDVVSEGQGIYGRGVSRLILNHLATGRVLRPLEFSTPINAC